MSFNLRINNDITDDRQKEIPSFRGYDKAKYVFNFNVSRHSWRKGVRICTPPTLAVEKERKTPNKTKPNKKTGKNKYLELLSASK